jgi:hypothetical protein
MPQMKKKIRGGQNFLLSLLKSVPDKKFFCFTIPPLSSINESALMKKSLDMPLKLIIFLEIEDPPFLILFH